MQRRAFITLLGGTAVAWPLAARAQQPGKLKTIGFFSPNTSSAASPWTTAFVQQLRDLGWIEGRTVTIAYRWGEGRTERAAEFMAELMSAHGIGCVKTHTSAKCTKYNSPIRHRAVCAQ
jgi:putative ABC transport system substrate-binding protein